MTGPDPRPPLVLLSPLPEMRNGIADYAATLLFRLAEHYRLICVVDHVEPVSPAILEVAEVISARHYARAADRLAGLRHLAHIGNNRDHTYILDILSRVPGVVVLHDLTLLYLLESWAGLSLGDPSRLTDIVRQLRGGPSARLVDFKFTTDAPLVSIYAEANCLELMQDIATGVITHARYGEVLLRSAGYSRDIAVVPHFADIPDDAGHGQRRAAWRARLGVGPDTVVFSSLGFPAPNKSIDLVLEALAALPRGAGDWRYVIAGAADDPKLSAACDRLGLGDRVIFLDYLQSGDFDAVLAASDVLVNLRFPTSGETSGTLCRALANRLPCVVSDHGWYAELPDAATYKVAPGRDILPELAAILADALTDGRTRAAKSAAAAGYAAAMLALDKVVPAYCSAIEAAWQAHGTTLNRPPARQGAVMQGPALSQATLAPRGLRDTLLAAFAHERVRVDGLPARQQIELDGLPFPDGEQAAERPGASGGDTAPRQICVALPYAGVTGRILNRVTDLWPHLGLGDFLTLALVEDAPPPVPDPGRCIPLVAGFAETMPAMALLHEICADSGMAMLRTGTVPVIPADADAPCPRIALATMRKASLAAPVLPVFRRVV